MTCSDAYSKVARALVLLVALMAAPVLAQDAKPFSKEQLDQMTAQVALYPDSLLSQLLMATTYPDEFAQAYRVVEGAPRRQGRRCGQDGRGQGLGSVGGVDGGLSGGADHAWRKTDWVKNMGDAFLAQPEDVMDSVQRLRAQAQKAGNLKSNEQVKVSTEAAPPPHDVDDGGPAGATAAGDRDRAGTAVGRLRAGVQPDGGVRSVALSGVSAVLLSDAAGLLVFAHRRHRHRLGRGHRRLERAVGRLQLGTRRRQHQRQSLQQHQRQQSSRRQQPQHTWNHDTAHRKRLIAVAMRRARASTSSTRRAVASSIAAASGAAGSRDASRERASQAMQTRRGVNQGAGSAREREQAMSRDGSRAESRCGGAVTLRSSADSSARSRRGAPARARAADRGAPSQRRQSRQAAATRCAAPAAGGDGAAGARRRRQRGRTALGRRRRSTRGPAAEAEAPAVAAAGAAGIAAAAAADGRQGRA